MKHTKLFALAGVLALGLVACGPTNAIDYNKAYMNGELKIGNLPCTVELYLKENNAALFDFTVNGNVPEGMPDFSTMLDLGGTYTYADKNYTFTVEVYDAATESKREEKFTTTFDEATKKHTLEYAIYSDLGKKPVTLVGALPLL